MLATRVGPPPSALPIGGSPPAVELSSAAPDSYFARVLAAYRLAAKSSGEVTHDLAIGPWPLRVSFASTELARTLAAPLRRLQAPASSAPLASIRTWDSASTGV